MFHIICDRIVSNDGLLHLIDRADCSVAYGHGDGATNGSSPDPHDADIPRGPTLAYRLFIEVPDEEEFLRVRSHNFH